MKKNLLASLMVAVGTFAAGQFVTSAQAGTVIPYDNAGTENPEIYNFIATATGPITAYFAGSDAAHTDTVGMLVNGVPTGLVDLNNHTSSIGSSFVLGNVNVGDTITFFLTDTNTGSTWYSNPTSPIANTDGANHAYSAPYNGVPAFGGSIPAGIYLGFEDLSAAQGGDFDYNDDQFVFTNVRLTDGGENTPIPGALPLFASGLSALGLVVWRRKRKQSALMQTA